MKQDKRIETDKHTIENLSLLDQKQVVRKLMTTSVAYNTAPQHAYTIWKSSVIYIVTGEPQLRIWI